MSLVMGIVAALIIIGLFFIGSALGDIRKAFENSQQFAQMQHNELKGRLEAMHETLAEIERKLPDAEPDREIHPFE